MTMPASGPKKHFLKFALEHRDTFEAIRNGTKKIETRAASVKYKNIKPGDAVALSCGKDSFTKKVKSVERFDSLRALFDRYAPEEIKPGIKTEKEMTEIYHSFPDYKEKIEEFGILAIQLED